MKNNLADMDISDRIKQYNKLFKGKVKKELILKEDNGAIFNTGAYKDEDGTYYLYPRTVTHHKNYPSWIRLYKSDDGKDFKKEKEFFISPEYVVEDYSYGCEDDRCSKIDDWFAHTYTKLLANNPQNPIREDTEYYIGVSLGRKPDEAIFTGIIDIEEDKDAACIKPNDKTYLLHRPGGKWAPVTAIWYGDFDKGFDEAKELYYSNLNNPVIREKYQKLPPPSKNRVLFPIPGSPKKGGRIGIGAPPMKDAMNDKKDYLFTYHVMDVPYQYWWSVGLMNEEDGQLKIKKVLPFPVCIPDTPEELIGDVPKVSFVGHLTEKDGMLEAWVGGADTYVLKATIEKDYLYSVIEDYGVDEPEVDREIEKYVKANKKLFRKNKLIDQEWLEKVVK